MSAGADEQPGRRNGWTDRLLSKRVVLVLVLVGAAVLLVTGSRVWLEGNVDDTVLGASAIHGTGSQVAKGVLGAALVGAAAAVAAATAGRLVRVVAALATTLAAALALVVVIRILLDPGASLGELAATTTGRTGTVPASGHATVWPWIAAAASLAMGVGGVLALAAGRRWSGLSKRYDAPAAQPRARSAWDQLSEGSDPTRDDAGRDVPGRPKPEGRHRGDGSA
ncbi:Trp biosynthesis-associated membrane protein [Segeticoccus rhizosphaerae]|uniref:Trp biosynthesis-associated membrane protein n=1 Tax=Segeticoccus rhizosphaerae TaxID=1104777 RepID=UPI0010C023AB|nr:Trp biosynthesis-associated membrane protein [Ornithinicoccus soli]